MDLRACERLQNPRQEQEPWEVRLPSAPWSPAGTLRPGVFWTALLLSVKLRAQRGAVWLGFALIFPLL